MEYAKKRNLIIVSVVFLAGLLTGGRLFGNKIFSVLSLKDEISTVEEVIDGDTFYINKDMRVRLMGINSPEKGECYYEEARQALKNLAENKQIKLEKDITDKDVYGRLLRYAILIVENGNNILINDYMISNGFAFAMNIPPDKHYRELFISGEEEAKKEKLGLWGACDYDMLDNDDLRQTDSAPVNPACLIKGNISEKGFGKTYLMPGCDNYERVKIDRERGESYFCTENEAIVAGFRKATNCPAGTESN